MSEKKAEKLPTEAAEMDTLILSVAQLVGKVGLQVNGLVAVAQANADAFNTMNPALEQLKNKAIALARENDALNIEVNRLRDIVNKKPKPEKPQASAKP